MNTYREISARCKQHDAVLIAVSKTRKPEEIRRLYELGQRCFAENRVQELQSKITYLPNDIEWHLIGHLQSNKVKQVLSLVSTIHSVDSLKLYREIEKQADMLKKRIKVLLQIFIASEETKFGMNRKELVELLDYVHQSKNEHVRIIGLMGMASNTNDQNKIREEFKELKQLLAFVKNGYFIQHDYFKELSMGMSGDYEIALKEGSTMVRVGSLLFA